MTCDIGHRSNPDLRLKVHVSHANTGPQKACFREFYAVVFGNVSSKVISFAQLTLARKD